jgi:hypothetical protein
MIAGERLTGFDGCWLITDDLLITALAVSPTNSFPTPLSAALSGDHVPGVRHTDTGAPGTATAKSAPGRPSGGTARTGAAINSPISPPWCAANCVRSPR